MVTCNEILSHWCVPTRALLLSSPLITVPITTALGNNSAERAAAISGEGFFLPVWLKKDYRLTDNSLHKILEWFPNLEKKKAQSVNSLLRKQQRFVKCLVSQIKDLCFCCVIMKINQLLTQVALKLDEKMLFSHPFGENNNRLWGALCFSLKSLSYFSSTAALTAEVTGAAPTLWTEYQQHWGPVKLDQEVPNHAMQQCFEWNFLRLFYLICCTTVCQYVSVWNMWESQLI